MPQFRTPQGAIVTIPEDQASSAVASGYEPVSIEQAGAVTSVVTPEDRGVLGAINAGATGLLSGATLGLSDYALKGLLDKGEFERLASERGAHPIASGLGQVAGAVIPAFGGPAALLAKTPAGALSRAVAPLAAEGAGGLLAAGAAEGALQNAGAYLSDTALGDRDLTAEGMFGALGAGGAFGVAGGAAALGIERGTIAARRLFSRAAGADKVALDAEQAWHAAHQSTLEAHDAAADIAKAQLAEARMAREQAQLAKQRAGLRVVETEQNAPTIDAAYRAAEVERDQVRDAAKAAYEAQPAITPQMREGLRGLGLTDADIAASSPSDLAAAMRLVEGADSELAAMSAPRPMSPAKEASLSQAVAEHDAARQELDDLLRNMEAPAIEPGVESGIKVPRGQFEDLQQRGPLAQGTPVQVTTVGKKLGEGTPADLTAALEPGSIPAEIAGEQQFRALQSDLRSKLTDEEIRLSKRYTADNYTDVNRLLRGEGSVLSKKEAEEIVPALDSILEKARTESPIVTHRAVVFDPHESGFALKPGDVFTDPAYMSTSYKSDNIGRFGNVHFVITSPAGTRIGAVPSLKSEGEMLLARGSKLRITGREELPGKDIAGRPKIRLHAIVEPDGAGASAGRTVTARPTQEASDDLTAALQGTSSKLGEGKAIGQIGAESPARAEYVASKLAKREEDAALFRSRAQERNYAGSGMAADEASARSTAQDEFFSSLTRPKTRDAYVAANIGRAMREEGSHAAALAKVEREWAEISGSRHMSRAEAAARAQNPGLRQYDEAGNPLEHPIPVYASGRPPAQGAMEDVAAAANVITKYERAAAKLTEELGPSAPPAAQEAAKAFRAAEEEADRKTMARTTRAIDDGVDSKGRPRTVEYTARKESEAKMAAGSAPPAPARPTWDELEAKYGKYVGQPALPPTSKEAIAAAKAEQKGADVTYKRTKVAETEARIGARRAQDIADQTRATAGKARPVTAAPPQMGTLGSIATAIGIAGEIGVPGVPHPKDIPVIGPLLSLYLKYKALKYATGRFVGRIGATGDSKAAALAAKTKDKIATAVDKTLGLVETGARKGRPAIVAASTVLGHRIFDDGEPDAKTGASDREMAAVRIREIANAATRPDLVKQYVARELRSVVDPDLHEAAERHLMARFEYLAGVMPKAPPPNPYSKREWLPSQADTNTLAQRLSVVHDPASAFSDPTPAKVDTLRNVSPKLLQLAQERLTGRIADTKNPVPYPQRLRASRLYGIPLDDSLDPQSISIIQSSHALNRPAPTPQPASPPVSSIAADTNLTSLYQTGMDRRAAR